MEANPAGAAERRALIIEDDEDIRELLRLTLSAQGFDVSEATDGKTGVEAARTHDPDLITLDLGLPGIDGIEVCRRIREDSDAYIIMITARQDEIDKLIGLESGADDFLAKPFSPRELQARVNALFRRPRSAATAEGEADDGRDVLEYGPLRVDVDGRQVFLQGTELDLTRTEFDLLAQLMRSPHRVWTREVLLRAVWGNEWATDTHLVEVHVGNLRRKLAEHSGDLRLIRTVRGVGYRMEKV